MAETGALFVDSSCLVAIALGEPGGVRLSTRLRRASRRFASTLAESEVLASMVREDTLAPATLFDGIAWVAPARRLSPELSRVLGTGYLRGADAWHLACALFLDPGANELVFATLDRRQRDAALAVGFRVL